MLWYVTFAFWIKLDIHFGVSFTQAPPLSAAPFLHAHQRSFPPSPPPTPLSPYPSTPLTIKMMTMMMTNNYILVLCGYQFTVFTVEVLSIWQLTHIHKNAENSTQKHFISMFTCSYRNPLLVELLRTILILFLIYSSYHQS